MQTDQPLLSYFLCEAGPGRKNRKIMDWLASCGVCVCVCVRAFVRIKAEGNLLPCRLKLASLGTVAVISLILISGKGR